jgi:hypothetical protein
MAYTVKTWHCASGVYCVTHTRFQLHKLSLTKYHKFRPYLAGNFIFSSEVLKLNLSDKRMLNISLVPIAETALAYLARNGDQTDVDAPKSI